MPARINILVAGGYDPATPRRSRRLRAEIVAFAKALGYEIIELGHNLLTGCQTSSTAYWPKLRPRIRTFPT